MENHLLNAFVEETFRKEIVFMPAFIAALQKKGIIERVKQTTIAEILRADITRIGSQFIHFQPPTNDYLFGANFRLKAILSFMEKPVQTNELIFFTTETPALFIRFRGRLSAGLSLTENEFSIVDTPELVTPGCYGQ